jgi:hypothetical protein
MSIQPIIKLITHTLYFQDQVKYIYEYRDYYLFKRSIDDAPRKDEDVKNELKKVIEKFDEFQGNFHKSMLWEFIYPIICPFFCS